MTSSPGDQLSALLGTQITGAGDADDVSFNAVNVGSKKGSADVDLPAGVHGGVIAIVKKMVNDEVESLEFSTPLTDYGFDCLGAVELAVRCEEELGARIEDKDISSFKILGDVADYIAVRCG